MRGWPALLDLIAAELGMDAAQRIERRARLELGGCRLTIPDVTRPTPTRTEVREALRLTGWDIKAAAKRLGVSRSWLYRRLKPPDRPRPPEAPARLIR